MEVTFGDYKFRYKDLDNKRHIFDIIRKKFVKMTPEELVRQHFLHFLTSDLGFSTSLISVEKQLTVNNMPRRTDIVLYDSDISPFMIIECKAHTVELSQDTFDQIAQYNMALNVKYLIISNGWQHHGAVVDLASSNYEFIDEFPDLKKELGHRN